jgi:hypothetical protein
MKLKKPSPRRKSRNLKAKKSPTTAAAKKISKASGTAPTDPTPEEIAARRAVARTFFDATSAAAARAAFLSRQQGMLDDAQ